MSLANGDSGSTTSAAPTGDSHALMSTVPTSEFSPSMDFSPSFFSLDMSDNFNIGMALLLLGGSCLGIH
jgi:hypothetical protein